MSDINRTMFSGRLGADPELRFTQSGTAVLNLRVASSREWFDKEKNEKREETTWMTATVWGKRGEALAKILGKGSQVFIEGSLRVSSYDDKNGEKRYKTEINVDELVIGARPKGDGDSAGEARPRGAQNGGARAGGSPAVAGGSTDDIPF